jgi:hypothetical protein
VPYSYEINSGLGERWLQSISLDLKQSNQFPIDRMAQFRFPESA